MIRLLLKNTQLDLAVDTKITLELQAMLQNFKLTGSYSFPFQLPTTDKNCQTLGFLNAIQVATSRNAKFKVSLFDDSLLVGDGTLTIRSTTRHFFDADITIPPGNIPLALFQTKMNEMDWGKETLVTKRYQPKNWEVAIDAGDVQLFGISDSKYSYEIYINGTLLETIQNVVSVPSEAKLKERCEEMVGVFNTNHGNSYLMKASDAGISISKPSVTYGTSTDITSAQIKVVVTATFPNPSKNFSLTRLAEIDIVDFDALRTLSSANFQGKNWRMGQVIYDLENNKYLNAGHIDYYTNPELPSFFDDRLDIAPSARVHWVLEKWAEMAGYSISGSFLSHASFSELCIYNAYVLRQNHPTSVVGVEVSNPVIEYKYMLPDWTFEEFISELAKVPNLHISIDLFSTSISIDFEDTLQFPTVDLSDKVHDSYILRGLSDKKIKLAYTLDPNDKYTATPLTVGAGDLNNDGTFSDDILAETYPTEAITKTNGLNYTTIESKMMPVRIRKVTWFNLADSKFYTNRDAVCGIEPSAKGNSSARLFFYIEKVTIDFRKSDVSLAWNDFMIGMNSYWKKTIERLENGFELEGDFSLSTQDILALQKNKHVMIDGVAFVYRRATLTLPDRGVVRCFFERT